MKPNIKSIILDGQVIMRSAGPDDIEQLRQWKNTHKNFFFLKDEITSEAQIRWFDQLSQNINDYMFVIQNQEKLIGCIGARLYNKYADIYNVILGDKDFKGKHIMTRAIEATIAFCNFTFIGKPVIVRVLTDNPAVNWYQKIGFIPEGYFEDYVLMEFMGTINKKYIFNIEIELP